MFQPSSQRLICYYHQAHVLRKLCRHRKAVVLEGLNANAELCSSFGTYVVGVGVVVVVVVVLVVVSKIGGGNTTLLVVELRLLEVVVLA